ncbi:MAG: hypothetical protein ACYTF6_11450, partial [Planctomycetota bacterium]
MAYEAASPHYLWFSGGGVLQRYDLTTRKFTVYTMLDGLPLWGHLRRVATSADDRCAIIFGEEKAFAQPGPAFLWRPVLGWRSLPPVTKRGGPADLAFDNENKLIALDGQGTGLYEFTRGKWQHIADVPESTRILPTEGGYLLIGCEFRGRFRQERAYEMYFFSRSERKI